MTRRYVVVCVVLLSVGFGGACSASKPQIASDVGAQKAEAKVPVKEVVFRELTEGVWLHTSFLTLPKWGKVPTNGLVVEQGDHSVLVDTAWNDEQTQQILQWAQDELGKPISDAVFTHAHSDKMGGVGILRERGVRTFAAADSNRFAKKRDLVPAENALSFDGNDVSTDLPGVVVFDPGAGHTVDNIVVALPEKSILFGGCLIRPPGTSSLGNVADADVDHWDDAVRAVAAQFPRAKVVIPSHGPPAGRELLDLTIELVEKQSKPSTSVP